MRRLAVLALAAAIGVMLFHPATAQATPCKRLDGTALRDELWRRQQPPHPLLGQVFKGDHPIAIAYDRCTRSPLQQLIVEVWGTIRGGGIVLLGEVHDNPEHHRVRGDILWPRLEPLLPTRDLTPGAVFEHIRTSQQLQLDQFYDRAARSRRLLRAPDLLRVLGWDSSGWPSGKMFEPLFDRALRAKLPILPGTPQRERARTLVRGDPADVTSAETASLGLARSLPQPLIDGLAAELEASHCGVVPASAFAAMSLAQRYTDAHLADRLAEAAQKHGGAFLLAGNGHVRSDRGVPWYLRQLSPGRKVVSVMLLEVEDGKADAAAYVPKSPDGAWAADYVLFTPHQARPDPCEALRRGRP
jgi:uncharacterized iron-regulated protein